MKNHFELSSNVNKRLFCENFVVVSGDPARHFFWCAEAVRQSCLTAQ